MTRLIKDIDCVVCSAAAERVQTPVEQHPSQCPDYEWFRRFRDPAYVNIYEKYPDEPRVFGTESLFGDWDADVLLLAKDYAPWHVIKKRADDGEERPYRAGCKCKDGEGAGGLKTNKVLVEKYLPEIPEGLRLLYGSVCGGLMRKDETLSGPLPDWPQIRDGYCSKLVEFTMGQMPNLGLIVALGGDAWKVVKGMAGSKTTFVEARRTVDDVRLDGHRCTATFHPSHWRKSGLAEWRQMLQTTMS